jgi:hypothetical protein
MLKTVNSFNSDQIRKEKTMIKTINSLQLSTNKNINGIENQVFSKKIKT